MLVNLQVHWWLTSANYIFLAAAVHPSRLREMTFWFTCAKQAQMSQRSRTSFHQLAPRLFRFSCLSCFPTPPTLSPASPRVWKLNRSHLVSPFYGTSVTLFHLAAFARAGAGASTSARCEISSIFQPTHTWLGWGIAQCGQKSADRLETE